VLNVARPASDFASVERLQRYYLLLVAAAEAAPEVVARRELHPELRARSFLLAVP
jgi:hypothetical protein